MKSYQRPGVLPREDPINPYDPANRGPLPEGATGLPGPALPTGPPATPPPTTTTTTTTTDGPAAQTANWINTYTEALRKQAEINAIAAGGGAAQERSILRGTTTKRPDLPWPGNTLTWDPRDVRTDEDSFLAEYWESVLEDTGKRQWLADRLLLLTSTEYDASSATGVSEADYMGAGYNLWKWAGEVVRMNDQLNKLTPEQYIDMRYQMAGGDLALEAAKAAKSPISTTTQTSTSTVTMAKAQADVVADQVATAALGRMASDAEMRRARGAMNRLLAANPTVSRTTTTTDATDPNNVSVSSSTHTDAGLSAADAAGAYEQKIRRSSEGMAFNVGSLMERAMMIMDRGL